MKREYPRKCGGLNLLNVQTFGNGSSKLAHPPQALPSQGVKSILNVVDRSRLALGYLPGKDLAISTQRLPI